MAVEDESMPPPFLRRRLRRVFLPSFIQSDTSRQLSQRLSFVQTGQLKTEALLTGLGNSQPLSFARSPDGTVYLASGLGPVMKWDGVTLAGEQAGVPAPTAAITLAFSGSGTITGAYKAYLRWLDRDGRPSNLSPASSQVTATSAGTVTYSGLTAPTDPRVRRLQILRNTAGQALTYYVDVDTTDVSRTSFTSTLTDTQLAAATAVPLFDADSRSLANRFAVPPNDKAVIVAYNDRMFLAAPVTTSTGHAEVTAGSATVRGIGTAWTSSLAGRFFYVVGIGTAYEISAVNTTAQTLTLTAVWREATDLFAVYAIRPAPANRRVVRFSEAGQYEAWPAVNGLTVPENGDEITGLMPADSFLFVLQRRHTWRLTYHLGPLVDGGLFLAANRGCVNHRCWVYLEGWSYLLDEQGVYRFAGAGQAESLSAPIQDLFWLNRSGTSTSLRLNWAAQRWFHAVHSRDEATTRWFVALSGYRLPRHALCFHHGSGAWWIEEYPFALGASCVSEAELARPLAAGPAKRVYALNVGTLDGPTPGSGTTRGTVTSATWTTLADTLATFPPTGLVGSPVAIVAGTGKGQSNLIASVSGTTLTLVRPWLTKPDTTSTYQLGAIPWRWRSRWFRWLQEEGDRQRRVEVLFRPAASAVTADLRLYKDHAEEPTAFGVTHPPTPADTDGITTTRDNTDAVVDLTRSTGFVQLRVPGRRERYLNRPDLVSLELRGFSADAAVTVHELNLEGAGPP